MNRVIAAVFALLAAVAAGWMGYRLSGAGTTSAASASAAADSAPVVNPEGALTRLLAQSYPDVGDRPQALQQWSGKVLVVNFWATWCPPCREEMPGFSRLQKKYAGQGVQFVGIGVDDADKIKQFQKDNPVTYPLLVAGLDTMSLTAALGNQTEGLPFTVFVDRDGHLRAVKVGLMDEPEAERELRSLL